jgi:hypothetical protein
MSYVNYTIKLYFNQSVNISLKPLNVLNISTSCYFKVVTLFIRNLFRVSLPFLLLIRRTDVLLNVADFDYILEFNDAYEYNRNENLYLSK